MAARRLLAALMLVAAFLPARAAFAERAVWEATAAELGMATGFEALRGLSETELDTEFAAYASLGATWVRTDLYWSNVQPDGPASYDWAASDRVVAAARAHGLEVLLVVGTTPPWARSIVTERSAPADPADYGDFLGAAVRRYAPQGVRAWEIWNEPNVFGAFPTQPDPIKYAELLVAAYAAVKAEDPEAIVLLGGLSPVVDTKASLLGQVRFYAAVDFLQTVYAQGAGDSFDAVAFHPYSFPRMPGDPAGWTGWSMMTGPIRRLMTENGDSAKKIWITEFGAPTNEARSKVSEAAQAEMAIEAATIARELDWAGPLFWYGYRDLGADPDDNEHWFGLLRADGSAKPSLDALKAALAR